MAENVVLDMGALSQLTRAWEGKQEVLAQLDTELDTKRQELAVIEARITAALAYEQALASHVEELQARLDALQRELTPEERDLHARLADLQADMTVLEEQRRALQGARAKELDEVVALVRRQRGGQL
jgi:chromosome segregation ATPase